MNEIYLERTAIIKETLLSLKEPEDRYAYLIELGRKAPPYPKELQTPEHIVPGCQSVLFLHTTTQGDKFFFKAHSEALISAGLAALLIAVYNDSTAQTILLNPPLFLQEIGLLASLSPNRSNGLASIYTRMKQEAMKSVLAKT
jgi:cysteine desulfuration protein SufE